MGKKEVTETTKILDSDNIEEEMETNEWKESPLEINLSNLSSTKCKNDKWEINPGGDELEIQDMIKGRAQDDDFIYFDMDSGEDTQGKGKSEEDSAYSPSSTKLMRLTPREARPARENAQREVIKNALANSAARIESEDKKSREASRESSQNDSSSDSSSFSETRKQPQNDIKKKGKTAKQRLAKAMKLL